MPPQNIQQNQTNPTPTPYPDKKHLTKARLLFFIIILILVGILSAGYFLNKYSEQAPLTTQQIATSTDEFADWKTYRNEEYGFEFKYPPSLNASICDQAKNRECPTDYTEIDFGGSVALNFWIEVFQMSDKKLGDYFYPGDYKAGVDDYRRLNIDLNKQCILKGLWNISAYYCHDLVGNELIIFSYNNIGYTIIGSPNIPNMSTFKFTK